MQLIYISEFFGFMPKAVIYSSIFIAVLVKGETVEASYHEEADKNLTPPVGSRVYIVPSEKSPYEPVEVVGQGAHVKDSKVFMRDPIAVSQEAVEKLTPKAKPVAIKSRAKFKPSRLRFPKVPIGGRYAKPRVKFEPIGGTISHANMRRDIDLKARMIDDAEKQADWLQSDW